MEGKDFMKEIGGIVKEKDKDNNEVDRIKNKEIFKSLTARLSVLARSRP